MDKYYKFLIVVVLAVALSLGGLYFYLKRPIQTTKPLRTADQDFSGTSQADLEFEETETKVTIGTQGVDRGVFDRVEGGNIYIGGGAGQTQYPLTLDEVVLACTNQDLAAATELDYDQVSDIKVLTPGEIGGLIPADETVVVFSSDVEGVLRVHTVAMDSSRCGD